MAIWRAQFFETGATELALIGVICRVEMCGRKTTKGKVGGVRSKVDNCRPMMTLSLLCVPHAAPHLTLAHLSLIRARLTTGGPRSPP